MTSKVTRHSEALSISTIIIIIIIIIIIGRLKRDELTQGQTVEYLSSP
jgi:hypothetical protein